MGNIFSQPVSVQPQQQQPSELTYIAYEDSSLKITFFLRREKQNPSEHVIKAIFTNKVPSVISQLNLQVAVQKYMKL